MELSCEHISVAIDGKCILDDVSLTVPSGAFVSLLGESGAGKSTTLKVIAGLQDQDQGSVCFDGEAIDGLPCHKREVAMVFQDIRLFPHMSVIENVAFPCKMRGMAKRERLERARECLKSVQLEGFENRKPRELSGGQAQRVALARAIAAHPKVLLLDEPFSGLDERLRDEMRSLVLNLHRQTGITSILVTHDAREALMMSDLIFYMQQGRIVQAGIPEALYAQPEALAVAQCFGSCSTLAGNVRSGEFICSGLSVPVSLLGMRGDAGADDATAHTSSSESAGAFPEGPARLVVRHSAVRIAPEPSHRADDALGSPAADSAVSHEGPAWSRAVGAFRVRCGVFAGDSYLVRLDLDGQTLSVPAFSLCEPDELVHIELDPTGVFLFPEA